MIPHGWEHLGWKGPHVAFETFTAAYKPKPSLQDKFDKVRKRMGVALGLMGAPLLIRGFPHTVF